MSVIIRITAGAEKLTLAPYTVCRLLDGGLEGFESPPEMKCSVHSAAFGDGGIFVGNGFKPREMLIIFEVTNRDTYPEVKDKILRIMSSKDGVEICADLFGRRRYIKAYTVGKCEFFRENTRSFPRVKLHFICPEPFFTEKTEKLMLPIATGLLTFPLNFMEGAGTVASFTGKGYSHTVYNPGDVPCGFAVRITAEGGDVTDPAILLNGKRLQLMETLKIGDVAVFDTRQGSRGISVNGVTRYNFLRQSEFFAIEPGENRITVMSTGNSANLGAAIEFTPFYAGA